METAGVFNSYIGIIGYMLGLYWDDEAENGN